MRLRDLTLSFSIHKYYHFSTYTNTNTNTINSFFINLHNNVKDNLALLIRFSGMTFGILHFKIEPNTIDILKVFNSSLYSFEIYKHNNKRLNCSCNGYGPFY